MTATTIKVDSAVRDKLACVARARGTTMTQLLTDVAQQLAEEQQWLEISGAYARLQRQDPEEWQNYLAELDKWDRATGDGLPSAREDWPEFNQ